MIMWEQVRGILQQTEENTHNGDEDLNSNYTSRGAFFSSHSKQGFDEISHSNLKRIKTTTMYLP